jgi:hypothetical protein
LLLNFTKKLPILDVLFFFLFTFYTWNKVFKLLRCYGFWLAIILAIAQVVVMYVADVQVVVKSVAVTNLPVIPAAVMLVANMRSYHLFREISTKPKAEERAYEINVTRVI